ncbi:AMP-binding protein [Streptomyces sp. TYQ1024]|uniref:AMP-binding protein n=1 Tax=Streptomyces sp. TYQ1024 TaxID=2762559 RepID=UPI001C8F0F0B|nr:AMP-binding protein [Streptomyces sp. TYQ1024]UKW28709.1 AMP-binding protein [Streptomyces sp. TYQ1024]
MEDRARTFPDQRIRFAEEGRELSLAELLEEGRETARALAGIGVRSGDLVAFVLPNGSGFLRVMLGAQYLGAVPVPLALPFGGVDEYLEHVAGVVADGGVRHVVVDLSAARVRERLAAALPGVSVVDLGSLAAGEGALPAHTRDGNGIAFIQYTSGSTSAPKGVVLTDANIVAGLRAITTPAAVGPGDRWGLWLPLFHDMGIFSLLAALSVGADVVLWQPRTFVRKPLDWLARFAEAGCTLCSAPNFFFDMLVAARRALRDERLAPDAGPDLSRWRLTFNGAEPVNAGTVEDFCAEFAAAGFRREAMYPVYGMAEATLAVTFPPLGREPVVYGADRRQLVEHGRAVPATDPAETRTLVGVGRPVPGVRVRIAADGAPAPEGTVGEIEISGPPVTHGYYRRETGEERTADGWFRTGDLGFLADGELYIVGRVKDMVIVGGVNYHAEDVEAVVRDHPGIYRKRCVAVLGPDETMAVVAETSLEGDAERAALVEELEAHVRARTGLPAVRVHLVAPRCLPQTSSGKFQRRKVRSSLPA